MEERGESTWKCLKRLLTLKRVGCCGSNWRRDRNLRRLTLSDGEEYEESTYFEEHIERHQNRDDDGISSAREASVLRADASVSLMRLLEEREDNEEEGAEEDGSRCCVCMGRKKRTAFIPCGHTFCRACSRELWSSRRSCPLCNRLILEILDIF